MGSDMSMEKIVTSTYGKWEMNGGEQVFIIYRKSSYDGKERVLWSGHPDTVERSQGLIRLLIGTIPERPEPVLPKRDRIWQILRAYYDYCDPEVINAVMEVVDEVDSTD